MFHIVGTAVGTVVSQRFAADVAILLDLRCLDDAPKNEDGKPKQQMLPERVIRAVWEILYADDAGVGSRPPGGLARMIDVAVVAYCIRSSHERCRSTQVCRDHTALQGGKQHGTSKRHKQTVVCTYL